VPKTLNQREAIKLLKANGWVQTIGGRHNVKMEKPGHRPVTLPQHQGRDYGTNLRSLIMKKAGIK
jgi:predicted RNA binding protein YcfA (HicA-like mRNA interferase family)